jgi:hypothetical protein
MITARVDEVELRNGRSEVEPDVAFRLTRGGFEPRAHVEVDPMRIMRESRNLPAQRLVDLSLVFE